MQGCVIYITKISDLVGLMAYWVSSYFYNSFSPISSPCGGIIYPYLKPNVTPQQLLVKMRRNLICYQTDEVQNANQGVTSNIFFRGCNFFYLLIAAIFLINVFPNFYDTQRTFKKWFLKASVAGKIAFSILFLIINTHTFDT